MEPKFGKYGIEYGLDGSRWSIDVMAADEEDAMRRIKQAAAFGTVVGREVLCIPLGPYRLWAPIVRWFRGHP